MITDKEIIEKQLKRINEKMRTNFNLHYEDEKCCICKLVGKSYMLPPYPLSNDFTYRSEDMMIEYLAGVDDAADFFTHNGTANGD